jgi:gamma-glutamylcyclotransferase (GGCT)/AIG2-like uncharacterized protein YtfP
MRGEDIFLFVYGSMKKGFINHHRLDGNAQFVGFGKTVEKFILFPAEHYLFPFVSKKSKDFNILGEIYKINKNILHVLDKLEGVPSSYNREEVDIMLNNSKKIRAYMYFKNELDNPVLSDEFFPSDEWKKEDEDNGLHCLNFCK